MADVTAFLVTGLSLWWHPAQAAVLFVLLVAFWAGGLYRSRLTMSVLDDLPYVITGVMAAHVAGIATSELLWRDAAADGHVRRFLLVLGAVLLVRAGAYATVRRARRQGRVRHTGLILGAGKVGQRLATTLQQHPELGLDPAGFVDSAWPADQPGELPLPVVGDYDSLADLIHDFDTGVVIVAFGAVREAQLIDVLRTCDRLNCEIFVVPRLFEMSYTTRDMDQAWGIPLVRVRRAPYRRFSWRFKRVIDVVVASVAILALAPVMALCAMAVRWEGGPGVLFRQDRVGVDGREFTVLKFRSLRPASEDEAATRWSIVDDARLGPVGTFLRSTSLDELPQLWNVLSGAMSLVGPRPERPHFVRHFSERVPRYMARHRVPAGVTGWAQVHGLRGDTSIEHRAGFDNYYIENWSLWGDIKIMLRTLQQVRPGSGG